MKDSEYCRFHGGWRAKKATNKRVDMMPKFYGEVLGKTLSKLVEEQTNTPKAEQFNFSEELAIMRSTGAMVLKLNGIATDALTDPKAPGTDKDKVAAIMSLQPMVQAFLKSTVALGKEAAAAENMASGQVTAHDISYVINQIIAIIHEQFGDEDIDGHAHALADRIRNEITLPGEQKSEQASQGMDEIMLEIAGSVPLNADLIAEGIADNVRKDKHT